MPASGVSRAAQNKKIRQDALREQLENKGLMQKVIEDAEKIANLDEDLDVSAVNRLKIANDLRMKLVAKYLPDLKSTELTGDPESPVEMNAGVTFVGRAAED